MQGAALAYFGVVTVTSLRIPYALLAGAIVLVLLWPPDFVRRAVNILTAYRILPALPVLALAALGFALHPYTRRVAHPSTGPDAMIVPVLRLLHGVQPYAAPLWDGALISPGPGWLLLNAPLSATGLIVLLSPSWLWLAAALLASRDAFAATLFVGALFASRDFLVQSIVGHDIFAVNLAVTALCLLVPNCIGHRTRLVYVTVLTGLVATARLPLVLLIPVFGLGLARREWRTGVTFTAVALSVAASTHIAFAIWAARDGIFYQPLHVFARARNGAGPVFMVLSAAGGAAACLAIVRSVQCDPARLMLCCWLLEFGLFAPIGLGELVRANRFDVTLWEGRNYVAWSLPLLCGYLALQAAGRHKDRLQVMDATPLQP